VSLVVRVVITGATIGALTACAVDVRGGAGPSRAGDVVASTTGGHAATDPMTEGWRDVAAELARAEAVQWPGRVITTAPSNPSPTAPSSTVPSNPSPTAPATGLDEIGAAVAAVVPAWARAAVQPTYRIGTGGCGDGCTWPGDPPTTEFSPWVLGQSFAFVEAAVSHEYAHAIGFTHLDAYRSADWSAAPEAWARQLHQLDAAFRGTDDREAFASCIATAWTGGYRWAPEQVRGACPLDLALWVDSQVESEVAPAGA
jgi:hypothetical protein